MKKIVTTLFCGVLSLSAFAQLQLNYNNAAGNLPGTVVIKTDMLNRVNIQGGGLPTFDPANNMHWDMSAVAFNTPVDYIGYDTNTSVVFIPSNYTGTVLYNLTPLIPYVTHPKFEIRTTDMRTYGEHLERQAFPIGFFTGTPTDSLVILNQDVLYSPFLINFPYPTAPNISNWQNSTTTVTNMELTYSSQSYNQTPISRVSHVTRIDSAVGWGTISAIRLDNQPGGEVDVIQIKNIIITQDSFYQSGGPIPSNILGIFGLTQGQMNYVYQYQWMRAGEVSNMMTVTYDDAQFTSIHDITLHRERLPFATSVSNVKKNNDMAIYPNPAGAFMNVSIKDRTLAGCNYEMMSITGQLAAKGFTALNSGTATIHTENLPSGSYLLRLTNNGVVLGQSMVSVAK
jgi:hypothetical protein